MQTKISWGLWCDDVRCFYFQCTRCCQNIFTALMCVIEIKVTATTQCLDIFVDRWQLLRLVQMRRDTIAFTNRSFFLRILVILILLIPPLCLKHQVGCKVAETTTKQNRVIIIYLRGFLWSLMIDDSSFWGLQSHYAFKVLLYFFQGFSL